MKTVTGRDVSSTKSGEEVGCGHLANAGSIKCQRFVHILRGDVALGMMPWCPVASCGDKLMQGSNAMFGCNSFGLQIVV